MDMRNIMGISWEYQKIEPTTREIPMISNKHHQILSADVWNQSLKLSPWSLRQERWSNRNCPATPSPCYWTMNHTVNPAGVQVLTKPILSRISHHISWWTNPLSPFDRTKSPCIWQLRGFSGLCSYCWSKGLFGCHIFSRILAQKAPRPSGEMAGRNAGLLNEANGDMYGYVIWTTTILMIQWGKPNAMNHPQLSVLFGNRQQLKMGGR